MSSFPIIDAHHHFWDVQANYHPWLRDEPMIPFRYGDYSSIRRNYLPDDYFEDAAGLNIVKTVYVETEWDPTDPIGETRWVTALHERTGFPNAVVAQAWLDRDDASDVIASQAQFGLVRSVRHKPTAAARPEEAVAGAPGSMSCENWRRGFAALEDNGLRFDLQTPWWHLGEGTELAKDFPNVQIILNHAGLPSDRSESALSRWEEALRQFSECDNTVLKISGIGQPGVPWTAETNHHVVRTCVDVFGVDRCMFASNFPVDGLAGNFKTIFDGFAEIVSDFSQTDQRKMFHDNAQRVYAID